MTSFNPNDFLRGLNLQINAATLAVCSFSVCILGGHSINFMTGGIYVLVEVPMAYNCITPTSVSLLLLTVTHLPYVWMYSP